MKVISIIFFRSERQEHPVCLSTVRTDTAGCIQPHSLRQTYRASPVYENVTSENYEQLDRSLNSVTEGEYDELKK